VWIGCVSILIVLAISVSTQTVQLPSRTQSGSAGSTASHEPQCRTLSDQTICRVGGPISNPRLVKPNSPPTLTSKGTLIRCPCRVLVWLIANANGRVSDAQVIRPVSSDLDQRAIDEVRTWLFEPAKERGPPASVEINMEVSFQ
jgi:TonB family protein